MLVTVTCTSTDNVYSLEVSPDIELENFKVLVQVESNSLDIPHVVFFHNGKILLGDKKTLTELGVSDNDVLIFGPAPGQASMSNAGNAPGLGQSVSSINNSRNTGGGAGGIDWGSVQLPTASSSRPAQPQQQQSRSRSDQENPESIRQMFLSDPHQMSLLKERNPKMADVINNPEEFKKILEEQRRERQDQEMARIRLLAADPFDMDAQRQIAEEIRMENVNQNMQTAMEHNPEAFAQVYMLYINCLVNGHPVKAFVDSGAQMTIMSKACAEKCNIGNLVDHRWQGVAVGVGSQKILGRVHMGQMQIENDFLPTSFTILENQPMDILLGLDMLKRHQCCIDLNKNSLLIGTTGTVTRFLNESELPECARLNKPREVQPMDEGSSSNLQEEEDRLLAEALIKSQTEAEGGGTS